MTLLTVGAWGHHLGLSFRIYLSTITVLLSTNVTNVACIRWFFRSLPSDPHIPSDQSQEHGNDNDPDHFIPFLARLTIHPINIQPR